MVFVLTQQRTLQTPALPPKLKRVKGTERRGETKSARSKILSEFKSKQCLWCHPVETDGEEPWEGVKRKRQWHTGKKTSVNGDRKKTEAARGAYAPNTHHPAPTPPPAPPYPLLCRQAYVGWQHDIASEEREDQEPLKPQHPPLWQLTEAD